MESEKSEVVAKAEEGYSLKTKALIACKHEHEVGIFDYYFSMSGLIGLCPQTGIACLLLIRLERRR